MNFGHTNLMSGHKELIISNTNGFIVLSLTDYCSITPHINHLHNRKDFFPILERDLSDKTYFNIHLGALFEFLNTVSHVPRHLHLLSTSTQGNMIKAQIIVTSSVHNHPSRPPIVFSM